jgi:hypothetical protein
LVLLASLLACNSGSRAPESNLAPSAPVASGDAAVVVSDAVAVVSDAAAREPVVQLVELARAEELWAFRLESGWVLARGIADRFYVSRLAGDGWVDEDALSKGLPARVVTESTERDADVSCNRIGLIAGKRPESAALVIDLTGSSINCSSPRGSYEVYRYSKASWQRDRAHRAGADSGIFVNWDLGAGVVGFTNYDLVDHALPGVTGLMDTWRGDPWNRRRALPFPGTAMLACGDDTGVVYVANKKTLYRVSATGARKIGDLPPFRPHADCVATDKKLYTLDESSALVIVDLPTGKSQTEPTTFTEDTSLARVGNRLVVVEKRNDVGRSEYFVHVADLAASTLTFTKRRIEAKPSTVTVLGSNGDDLWLHLDLWNEAPANHVLARLAL